jgi:hypothetical protein
MNSQNPLHIERLDNAINNFISSNDIEVIDIKYSTCVSGNEGRYSWFPSAMLIYRTRDAE